MTTSTREPCGPCDGTGSCTTCAGSGCTECATEGACTACNGQGSIATPPRPDGDEPLSVGVAEQLAREARDADDRGEGEDAHWREDHLRRRALRAVMDGHPHARALARIALSTDTGHPRWYA